VQIRTRLVVQHTGQSHATSCKDTVQSYAITMACVCEVRTSKEEKKTLCPSTVAQKHRTKSIRKLRVSSRMRDPRDKIASCFIICNLIRNVSTSNRLPRTTHGRRLLESNAKIVCAIIIAAKIRRYCNLIVPLLQKREKSWLPRERSPPPRTHSGTTERTPANIRCAPHAVASCRRPNMVRRKAILLLTTNNSKN